MDILTVHRLRRTDRLETLSAYYRVPVCMIMRANSFTHPQDFLLCKEVLIPKKSFCNKCGIEQPPEEYDMYTVEPSDTLFGIARKYGLTMNIIIRTNRITDPMAIQPGDMLRIPLLGGELYCVRPGDTIANIAKRYGLSESGIRQKNCLLRSEAIHPGMQLLIG
jgi:spore germination protein